MSEFLDRLIEGNIALLDQGSELIETTPPALYAATNGALYPHRAGAHFRHVLEFYECFLEGLAKRRVDYNARRRDPAGESDPAVALARIARAVQDLRRVRSLGTELILLVRPEACQEGFSDHEWLISSVGRELQVLQSHTTHHYALIALTLRLQGVAVAPEFGTAPSTLLYQRTRQVEEFACAR